SHRGQAVQCCVDRLRRRLPPDEPGGRHRAGASTHRAARILSRASAWRRGAATARLCSRGGGVMDGLNRGSPAIVGGAEAEVGEVADGMSVMDLMAQGAKRALDDCGLSLKDVDGLFSATTQSRLSVLALAEYLGVNPSFLGSTIVGGSSFEYHVAHAMGAIALGLCNVAVIAYGSTQRSVGRKQASVREVNPYETPFKPFLPASAYALAASRHFHEFGTTREQLAAVAVAAREWALLNPAAWEKKSLTIGGVLSSRIVSYPFTVRDCCLVTDGGGAIVVTSAERAKSLKKAPLRGECGVRQVKNCEVALAHGNGGVLSSQATVILGTQTTL